MRKTKIVATIGPAIESREELRRLIEAGVDVVRFNMKHNTTQWHAEWMEQLEQLCRETGKRVGILLDLQGPEVRIDVVPPQWSKVNKGEKVRFSCPGGEGVELDHGEIFGDVKEGQKVYADDGFLEFRVVSAGEREFEAEVVRGGKMKERKTVNFPGMKLNLPTLIEKDLEHVSLTARHHVDFVALSYVRSAHDIEMLRDELKKQNVECKVIAKIEHPEAVENFDEILEAADGVMVARGDLGLEYSLEEVPGLQRMMVQRCREEGLPVIIATQMLESMVENPRPTRAEVSDVATAVYEGADALMLSAETAAGDYPVEAVETMIRIAGRVEKTADYMEIKVDWDRGGQTAAVVAAAHKLMEFGYRGVCDLKAFVVMSETGKTVQYLSRLRPELTVYALSDNDKTLDQLKLSWGVVPVKFGYSMKEKADVKKIVERMSQEKVVQNGDRVIMIYGEIWGEPGLTSVVRVQAIVE